MKGTLFSSDFAVDGSDNLRLLEINTDSGITSASYDHFDFTPLYNTWNSHSIAELHVIYKDHQRDFVDFFSGSISSEYTGSINFNYHIEESNTVYPYTITDAADKFILRLSRDTGALILTNDLYKEYRDEFDWIDKKRVPYSIINGELYLHPIYDDDK